MSETIEYKHYGFLQYRSRPNGKWRYCRTKGGFGVQIDYNCDNANDYIPEFLRDFVRVVPVNQEAE